MNVYGIVSTVGGAGITVSSGKFGGFILNGSEGGSTLTIKNGSTTVISTSVGANVYLRSELAVPVAFDGGIVITCSGTGFYSLLYQPNP